jgi:putative hemolysin
VDGLLNLHEFAEQTGIDLPEGPYETAAGFVLARLGEVPREGQSVEVAGHRITVTEMDGRRIARLRIAPAGGHDQSDVQPPGHAQLPGQVHVAEPSPDQSPDGAARDQARDQGEQRAVLPAQRPRAPGPG